MKREPEFLTEAALCAAFVEWAKDEGFVPYAETAGWDLLLIGADGTQVGVQAKMKWNMKVLMQTLPGPHDDWRDEGPDYRSILLPSSSGEATHVCGALGIQVFAAHSRYEGAHAFSPTLRNAKQTWHGWHFWCPLKRHQLPAYVPDVAAGASGPVQLTHWKCAALKICALLELRGHVTRADFKRVGIDHRRWTGPGGWLAIENGAYVRGPQLDFDKQHPTVYQLVLADVRKEWLL